MGAKSFLLKIDEPCQQNWNEMGPAGQGRFCNSCNKVVIDFTNMGPEMIAEYFRNPKDKVCGQFKPSQLDYTYTISYKSPWAFNKTFLKFSLAGILIFAGVKGFSQTTTKRDDSGIKKDSVVSKTLEAEKITIERNIDEVKLVSIVMGGPRMIEKERTPIRLNPVKPDVRKETKITIHLKSENNNTPVKNGSVSLGKPQKTYVADANGTVTISVADSLLSDKIGIYYTALGFETIYEEIELKGRKNISINKTMRKEEMLMKGQVIKYTPTEPKKNCSK